MKEIGLVNTDYLGHRQRVVGSYDKRQQHEHTKYVVYEGKTDRKQGWPVATPKQRPP